MMPRAPKKCARDGCEVRGTGRTCPAHKVGWSPTGRSHTNVTEHKAWRKAVLARDRGACQIRGPHCTGRATEVDHIRNVAAGGAEFDIDNGQAVCPTCHKVKTQRESRAGRT